MVALLAYVTKPVHFLTVATTRLSVSRGASKYLTRKSKERWATNSCAAQSLMSTIMVWMALMLQTSF